ncbi:MAG: hypothetical protein Q8P18_27720 [Pseudomonadota bacterium]|nr:hypothetical protein [Pseudomonadota bacterium]
MFRLCTVLLGLAAIGLPEARAAECHQYAVDDSFAITQSNGYHVTFQVTQDETGAFKGTALVGDQTGTVMGTIADTGKFDMLVTWENGSVGDYTGWVGADGKIVDGTGFDRSNPASRATWTNLSPLRCAD